MNSFEKQPGVAGKEEGHKSWINPKKLREQRKLIHETDTASDRSLQDEVISTLRNSPEIDTSGLRLNLIAGILYIFGDVKTIEDKRAVESIVYNVPHIREVNSNINVKIDQNPL